MVFIILMISQPVFFFIPLAFDPRHRRPFLRFVSHSFSIFAWHMQIFLQARVAQCCRFSHQNHPKHLHRFFFFAKFCGCCWVEWLDWLCIIYPKTRWCNYLIHKCVIPIFLFYHIIMHFLLIHICAITYFINFIILLYLWIIN